jgi:hypothetical protein
MAEKLVDAEHRRVLQFRVAALFALENRQRFHDHDRGVRDLEWQIGYPPFQYTATNSAPH